MKVVSDRISILKKDDLLSIVILPTTDQKKTFLLFLWLFAWSVCGVIVLFNYKQLVQQDAKIFVIVYLAFWLYYEFKIARAFIWKKWGKEKIWLKSGKLNYQREVNQKGKINEYELNLLDELKLIEISTGSFSDFFNQSFWVKGGERIEFKYLDKFIRFGMQINTEEARILLSEIKQYLQKSK
ncbi:MAG: hypothetical protein IPM51_13710 [Sphingobacteriaceae bacterium]|nr:hypothetical protein [Sphingobacteriaceae bacterium]